VSVGLGPDTQDSLRIFVIKKTKEWTAPVRRYYDARLQRYAIALRAGGNPSKSGKGPTLNPKKGRTLGRLSSCSFLLFCCITRVSVRILLVKIIFIFFYICYYHQRKAEHSIHKRKGSLL
jgi:hypothetical protein